MKNKVLKVMFIITMLVTAGYAQKLSFPAEKPSLSVEFPKGWSVEIDQNAISGVVALSKDAQVEFDIWMLDPKSVNKDYDKAVISAIDEISELVDTHIKDFKIIEQKVGKIDGIKYVSIEGIGTDRKNAERIQVYAEVMTPNDKEIFVMLYWASKEAEDKNLKEINEIFNSVKKVK